MRTSVVKSYQVQYPDPIILRAGELVTLGTRDQEYPGWIWATSSADGRCGWVPQHFLAVDGTRGRALRDYSAQELAVTEGDGVQVIDQVLGWALVESDGGRQGWVPVASLDLPSVP